MQARSTCRWSMVRRPRRRRSTFSCTNLRTGRGSRWHSKRASGTTPNGARTSTTSFTTALRSRSWSARRATWTSVGRLLPSARSGSPSSVGRQTPHVRSGSPRLSSRSPSRPSRADGSGRVREQRLVASVPIRSTAVVAAPKDYPIPPSQEIILQSVRASFLDNGAGGDWVPALQILDNNGNVLVTAADKGVTVTAGSDADVSWFPGVKVAGGASTAVLSYAWGWR